MKLFGSLLTTGLIITCVWGIALLQVPSAEANTISVPVQSASKEIETLEETAKQVKQNISSNVKVKSSEINEQKSETSRHKNNLSNLTITGVSERVSINNIASLWQSFDDKTLLHTRLMEKPNKVYVYYRNFSKDYQSADVSIGYAADIIKPSTKATTQINGNYQQLLIKGAYTTTELTKAWQKIDYRQRVHSVVEVHYLDKNSQPIATEVLVKYL
ncbi:hypothetical protein [Pseudoalteromonas sp. OANN1]|uniref:hypothetical protein n=1 Tax=Pseudoalteromonas sp. OANN1 TaxID=2954497 RepID=UPI002097B17E|nr:hypothetical protein [Pseudoalteromonas sp. OANN1]MCO7197494.1 hypothetical protein [Pseudoalteromonas sp. OANN1]